MHLFSNRFPYFTFSLSPANVIPQFYLVLYITKKWTVWNCFFSRALTIPHLELVYTICLLHRNARERERDVQWRLSNTRPVLFNRIIRNGTLHNLILRSVLFPQKLTCKRRHPLTVFWTPEIWPSSSYVWISSDLYDCSWAQISNFLLSWNYSSCDINGQLVIKEPWQLGTTVWSLWGIINSRAHPPNPTRNAIPWVEY